MDRIVIIGCGGSGKSTLARRLARIVHAPLTHLDAIYYDEQWKPLLHDEFVAEQENLVAGKRWIIDGHYASALNIRLVAADTVVFLDLSAATCLWGIAQRRWDTEAGNTSRTASTTRSPGPSCATSSPIGAPCDLGYEPCYASTPRAPK